MKASLLLNRWWPITAFAAALTLLATAHAFQRFADLEPCHLCLKQRDIYWIAVLVSGFASVWAIFTGAKGPPRAFSFILFAIFTTGSAIAIFHAGAELQWWHGPQSCTSSNAEVSLDQIAALMSGEAQVKPPQCDIAPWHLWGVSMAGYNAMISALLALISLLASMRISLFKKQNRTNIENNVS